MTTRTRTRGKLINGPTLQNWQINASCAQTSWTLISTNPGLRVGRTENMSDVVTSRFKRRVSKGEILMNPMTYQSFDCTSFGGTGPGFITAPPSGVSCSTTGTRLEGRQDGDWFPVYLNLALGSGSPYDSPPPVASLISSTEIARLASEVSTSCWADRQLADSNLFESVAEYRQTMKLFGDLFIESRPKLKKLLGDLLENRVGNSKTVAYWSKKALTRTSGFYLMGRYGIGPLISDVQSIVSGIGKKTGSVRKTTRKSGSISRSTSSTGTMTGIVGGSYHRLDNDEIIVRAMSIDEYNATLAANIGFSDAGFLTTPWELVPWSFVLDWFVNVGKYLQALAPMQGRKQLGSCVTMHRSQSSLYTMGNTTPGAGYAITRPLTGSILCTLQQKSRQPSLAPPELLVKNDFRFSEFTRAADALALVIQLVKKVAAAQR